ncbi:putative dNA replication protein (plasmid) [Acinetobacter baumannii]|nr:putative dNA replication protein [Acinetobacter baumannii]
MTDAQRHLFSHKLSELPEMGKYSHGTESYPQFAVRIAEMLQNQKSLKNSILISKSRLQSCIEDRLADLSIRQSNRH